MRKRLFYLAALVLLAPTPLRAQNANPAGAPGGTTGGTPAAHDRRQTEEDIEIMRRLLGRALTSPRTASFSWDNATGRPIRVALNPEGKIWATKSGDGTVRLWDSATGKLLSDPPETARGLGGLEGVYLKGYGVVYTVTMPPLPHAAKPPAAKPAPKTLNDWERVRKELRGDKVEEAAPAPSAPPSLADSVLRVLAKNGRHFSSLGANERLTVVVTFREPHASAGPITTSAAAMLGLQAAGVPVQSGMPGMSPGGGAPGMPGGPSGMMPGLGQPASKRLPESARDHELVGDLHMKQSRALEALRAYTSALNTLVHERGPATDAHKRALYRKLAHAYLGLADRSNPTNHEKIIAKALEWLRAAQEPKTAEPAAASARLPAKLIVSAPKSTLDAAGSGEMTFEEFRQAASVTSVTAAAVDRVPASRSK